MNLDDIARDIVEVIMPHYEGGDPMYLLKKVKEQLKEELRNERNKYTI